MLTDAEVVIVGGGPVGLATALELKSSGRDVLVVDRAQPPIDKACGEGLMPDGVRTLMRLGVEIDAAQQAPIRGIRYLEGDLRAEAEFSSSPGAGIRRTILHQAMVERSSAQEVRMLWGVAVRGMNERGLETDQGTVRADWIIGADGLHSRIREWAGLAGKRPRFRRQGVRRHFAVEPWTDRVEVYWANACEAYVTPLAARQVGVAVLWSEGKADFESLLTCFPLLKRRLQGAPVASSDRGAGQLEQHARAVHQGRVALVGDAAGYRDAITGEGLSLGFHQARALGVAIAAGDLKGYDQAVRRLTRLPFLLIRLLLEAERRPALRHRLVRTLAGEPRLFAKLLAIHARQAPPRSVGAGGFLRLARGLLG